MLTISLPASLKFIIKHSSRLQLYRAPCHGTRAVKTWLARETFVNHGNSPELNIIENVSLVMKQKMAAHNPTSEALMIH